MGESKVKKQARSDYPVTPEEFIEIWQTSETADEVVKRASAISTERGGAKMPKPIVHARASTYRNMGIKLKKMPRANSGLDIESLNLLVEELDRKAGRQTEPSKTRGQVQQLDASTVKEMVKQVVQEVQGSKGKQRGK